MQCNPFHTLKPGFQKLYIFGAGGFGREVAWLAQQSWGNKVEVEFLVDLPADSTQPINGCAVRRPSEILPGSTARFVVAVGDPSARRRLADRCSAIPLLETTVVHPRAEASDSVKLGPGTIICAGSILTANIRIGRHVHVNLDCTVGHDVLIGEFATLAPGVHVSGQVHIGQGVYIGTGATIINGTANVPLVIGDDAVIAAGACVTRAVAPGALVAGVPAVRKR